MNRTALEQELLADAPQYLILGTDEAFIDIGNGGMYPTVGNDLHSAGLLLVPADGIMGTVSRRFFGDANRSYVTNNIPAAYNTSTLSVVFVIGDVRNGGGTSAAAIFGRQSSGGWIVNCSSGLINFIVMISGTYRTVSIDSNLLSPDGNILHGTFDGQYLRFYLNGVLKSTYDAGAGKTITWGGAASIPMIIGAASSSGGPVSSVTYGDFDFSYFGQYGFGLTQARVAAQAAAFSAARKIAGTALLDDGSAAPTVVLTEWNGWRRGSVTPNADGSFAAAVPPGDYLVTALGPAGYRPISHGPVTAVAP